MALIKEEWTSITEQPVRWGDMDSFNHVNNTIYFKYFESARIDYFQLIQWGSLDINDNDGFGPILAHTSCQFIKPVRYPDQLSVGVRSKKIGNSSLIHEYEIHSEKLGLVARGEGVIVSFNYKSNSKMPFPDDLRKRILDVEVLDLG